MHYFSTYFGKELYMIRTDLLSIIRSHGICHTSDVDCLQGNQYNKYDKYQLL